MRGAPGRGHAEIINDRTIINNIRNYNRIETERGRYYWHNDGGHRFAHHYDDWGYHWYGWYMGSSYFWARYHNDYWWWNDEDRARWLYWHAGYWWWRDPVNVTIIYIYVDGVYYRYEDRPGGPVVVPEPSPAPAPGPGPTPPPAEDPEYYSVDGSRLVRIYGEKLESFLYDSTKEEPSFLTFLSAGTRDVQYSDPDSGQALTINLTVEERRVVDGEERTVRFFKLFDADGRALPLGPSPDEGTPASGESAKEGLERSASFEALKSKKVAW